MQREGEFHGAFTYHFCQVLRSNGQLGSREAIEAVVQQLQAAGRLAGLAVYGSPYLWEQLHPVLPPQLPAAYSPGQMPQAQAVLLEHLGLKAAALEGGFTD